MQSRLAVIRADAFPNLGTGHVSRCLALADRLVSFGWRCVFAVARGTIETVPALAKSDHRVAVLDNPNDAVALGSALDEQAGLVVVDQYCLDATFERACRAWSNRILVIDDLADRPHDGDILVDQTLGRHAIDYAKHVPSKCRLLLGPEYALLRPDFARWRPRALARRDGHIRRILVSIGGSDPRNITSVALCALHASGLDCAVDVVLGSSSANREQVRAAVESFGGRARLHLDTPRMAELMRDADLAIGACGVTSWERCVLGLPTLAVVIADNQKVIARGLESRGAIAYVGDWNDPIESGLTRHISRLVEDPGEVVRIGAAAAMVCDGEGLSRVASVVMEE